MPRLCRFIQTIIAVTVPTATSPMIVSRPSCCFCGSEVLMRSSAIPTPRQITIAATTPIHIHRSASRRSARARNAATMPTMRDASIPSRRPITKVGIMGVGRSSGVCGSGFVLERGSFGD